MGLDLELLLVRRTEGLWRKIDVQRLTRNYALLAQFDHDGVSFPRAVPEFSSFPASQITATRFDGAIIHEGKLRTTDAYGGEFWAFEPEELSKINPPAVMQPALERLRTQAQPGDKVLLFWR